MNANDDKTDPSSPVDDFVFGIRDNKANAFLGVIDEARVYSRVLSEPEIIAHYNEFLP